MEPTEYVLHRPTIKSGDLLSWPHTASPWRSWYDFKIFWVRVFTRSEYSHVGVAWVFGGRVFAIESVTPLVRIVPLSNLLPCYHTPVTNAWSDAAEAYAMRSIGTARYSKLDAVWAFFDANNKVDDRLSCAEFVNRIYDKSCGRLSEVDTPTEVTLGGQQRGGATCYLENGL
jgi:hypothetical protein